MFLGKPGGGKSFGALRDIVDEIVNGHRRIVTNLSLDIGALSEWIQKNFPDADFDPHKRIRLLTDSESKRFWMARGPRLNVDPKTADTSIAEGHFGIVTPRMHGVLFVIDECHLHFDARQWKENGLELTYYNSQHRKFNDEVIFVTQFLDLVDKRVKGFAQEYVYFVNNGLQRFMTHFRLPSFFTVKTYSSPKTGGAKNPDMATARYQLDVTLAACYDTSAGVGIPGRKKHETNRVKGLPIYWIVVPACGIAALLFYTPDLMTRGVIAAVDRAPSVGGVDTGTAHPGNQRPPSPMGGPAVPPPTANVALDPAKVAVPAEVYVRSVMLSAHGAYVTLSNGQLLQNGAGLARISKHYVYDIEGKRYRRYPSPPAPQAPPVT